MHVAPKAVAVPPLAELVGPGLSPFDNLLLSLAAAVGEPDLDPRRVVVSPFLMSRLREAEKNYLWKLGRPRADVDARPLPSARPGVPRLTAIVLPAVPGGRS